MGVKRADEIVTKTPDEVRKVDFDFTNHNDLATNETISTVSDSSVTPALSPALTIDSTSISGTIVQVTLSSGADGTDYTVKITVTTSDSQTLVAEGLCRVRS